MDQTPLNITIITTKDQQQLAVDVFNAMMLIRARPPTIVRIRIRRSIRIHVGNGVVATIDGYN